MPAIFVDTAAFSQFIEILAPEPREDSLRHAAWTGDLARVKRLMGAWVAEDRGEGDFGPGHPAAEDWAPGMGEAPETSSSSPEEPRVCRFPTALMLAAERGHSDCVEALLSVSDARCMTPRGLTALHWAAARGHARCVELLAPVSDASARLIPQGLTQEEKEADELRMKPVWETAAPGCMLEGLEDWAGITPLMMAARGGHAPCVAALLPFSNPNLFTLTGESAFFMSLWGGWLDCVKILAPISSWAYEDGVDALMWAAYFGQEECLKFVLPSSNPKAASNDGMTALHHAACSGAENALALLLPLSDPNARTGEEHEGKTPLMMAAFHANSECVKLLAPKTDLSIATSKRKSTPLHWAAAMRDAESVSVLLSLLDARTPNDEGFSPLMYACGSVEFEDPRQNQRREAGSALETVRLLLPFSDANAQNADGKTALHMLAEEDEPSAELVKLLGAQSDPKIVDKNGVSPLMAAIAKDGRKNDASELSPRDTKSYAVLDAFRSVSDVNAADGNGNSVLMRAIWRGSREWALKMIEWPEIDIDWQNEAGEDALRLAIKKDWLEGVLALLARGTPKTGRQKTKEGSTAFMAAASMENPALASAVWGVSNPQERLPSGVCAVEIAASNDESETFELLLPTCDWAFRDEAGENKLMRILRKARRNIITRACAGAPAAAINALNKKGQSALMVAIEAGAPGDALDVLKRIDESLLCAKDAEGNTALEMALKSKMQPVADQLMARLSPADFESAFFKAAATVFPEGTARLEALALAWASGLKGKEREIGENPRAVKADGGAQGAAGSGQAGARASQRKNRSL